MVATLGHRGPDDRSTWASPDGRFSLGHTRLAILDRSSAGRQPMSYADGRLWIAFNGEVYNFREIRKELEGLGHWFRTATDTEVVLAAYLEWGTNAIRRFRGMFAFALVDLMAPKGAPELVLARDRFGIKPILIYEKDRTLWFASELKTLLGLRKSGWRVNKDALLDYFAEGSVFQPRTIVEGINALPAGHWMEVRANQHRLVKYWDLHEDTIGLRSQLAGVSRMEAIEMLRGLLLEATKLHMIADVPVGAFLSGGIDSTAIVGLMTKAANRPVKTFSLGFEAKYGRLDERSFARQAADYLGSDHQEIVVTSKDVADIFPGLVAAIDQPSIDGANTWLVSRAARSSVTVALSGLGGDELFAGYKHFGLLARIARTSPNGLSREIPIWESARRWFPAFGRLDGWLFAQQVKANVPSGRLALLRRVLGDHELGSAVQVQWSGDFRQRLHRTQEDWLRADADPVQQTSYAEVRGYLQSTLLRDGDVMSMAHGLEVRPVLLDHRLAEVAYALPAELKWVDDSGKKVFVDAIAEFLPANLRTRDKMGFSLPFAGWMSRELRPVFETLLELPDAKTLFTDNYRLSLQRRLREGRPPQALWAWGILLAWLRMKGILLA